MVMERIIARQPVFFCLKLFYILNIKYYFNLGINAKLVLKHAWEASENWLLFCRADILYDEMKNQAEF